MNYPPGHPLHEVPEVVLWAARNELEQAEMWGSLRSDDDCTRDSIADAVVVAVLPELKKWLAER